MAGSPKSFGDYQLDRYQWITTASAAFYPDYLVNAATLYKPVMERFGQLLEIAGTSEELFWQIDAVRQTLLRTQLWRVFRKYVSPATSVDMLKVKQHAKDIVARFS